jgi:Fic family protein
VTQENTGVPRDADEDYSPFTSFDGWSKLWLDQAAWDREAAALANERDSNSADTVREALEVAIRSAAVETGAIEGLYPTDESFTITVATQATAWQEILAEHGESLRKHFEAQLRTYHLVLDAASGDPPITEAFIRRVHEEICAAQETYDVVTPAGLQKQRLPLGEYKRQPNHVLRPDGSSQSYAPVASTAPEMHRLVEELTSLSFKGAHPVLQAAFAHYGIVAIHPFSDGNGRVARAIASSYLFKAVSVPFLVFSDQRATYIAAVRAAGSGQLQAFADYASARTLAAMSLIVEVLQAKQFGEAAGYLSTYRSLLVSAGGLTHQELDTVALSLAEAVAARFQLQIDALERPGGLVLTLGAVGRGPEDIGGYRRPIAGGIASWYLEVTSAPPAAAQLKTEVDVLVAKDRRAVGTFAVRSLHSGRELHLALSDVHPLITAESALRLDNFVKTSVAESLAWLTAEAEVALQRAGYGG